VKIMKEFVLNLAYGQVHACEKLRQRLHLAHVLWNMFVFACPIIAGSQCWLFALKYPYWPPNSTSGIS
jgi:hypothetical protein